MGMFDRDLASEIIRNGDEQQLRDLIFELADESDQQRARLNKHDPLAVPRPPAESSENARIQARHPRTGINVLRQIAGDEARDVESLEYQAAAAEERKKSP